MAFSRMISAAKNRSGWSVTWSSGKYGSPSGNCFRISSSSSWHPAPRNAEMGTIAANSKVLARESMRGRSFGLAIRSTLLSARIVFPRNRFAFSSSKSSACGSIRVASTISSSTSMPSSAAATSCIICRPSAESASCSPGVSIKMICPCGLVTIPWMRLRVVCGLEVTIAIFCPTRRFMSVDFPAFGRPMMATNPERNVPFFSSFSLLDITLSRSATYTPSVAAQHTPIDRPRLKRRDTNSVPGSLGVPAYSLHLFADPHTQHFSLICFQHFEAVVFEIDLVSRCGNFAGRVAEQTSEGSHCLICFVAEFHAKQFLDVADGHAAAHHQTTICLAHHIRRRRPPIIQAFTDDFFHQVFDRRDACHGSVFVDDHSQRTALLTHLAQQFRANLGFRHKQNGFSQFPHLALGQILVRNVQKVLRVCHAKNIVE